MWSEETNPLPPPILSRHSAIKCGAHFHGAPPHRRLAASSNNGGTCRGEKVHVIAYNVAEQTRITALLNAGAGALFPRRHTMKS